MRVWKIPKLMVFSGLGGGGFGILSKAVQKSGLRLDLTISSWLFEFNRMLSWNIWNPTYDSLYPGIFWTFKQKNGLLIWHWGDFQILFVKLRNAFKELSKSFVLFVQ